MKAWVIIIVVVLYVNYSFSFLVNHTNRCPGDTLERALRGKALCKISQDYHCLYDDYFKLSEICQSYKQLPKGNYPRYSSFGDDIYYDRCLDETYQHGPAKSYQITECLFEKSKCVSEGQRPCATGTTFTDSTCSCDFKNGYASFNGKCCSPLSDNDCTCYKKPCPENHTLDSDYKCVPKPCPVGFYLKEGEHRCTRMNREENTKNSQINNTIQAEDLNGKSTVYSYFVPEILIYSAIVLYSLHFIILLGYGIASQHSMTFQLVPFSIFCVCVLICYGITIEWISEKMTPKFVMIAFVLILSGLFLYVQWALRIYEIAKERLAYNEYYELKIFQLLNAAANGKQEELENLTNEGYVDMEDTDYDNRSALHLAAVEGQVDVVKFLVKNDLCYIDAVDRWNRTAADDVRFHLERNKIADKLKEKYHIIINTLEDISSINEEKPKMRKKHFRLSTAYELIEAAENGDFHFLRRMKRLGTDMNISNSMGRTALHAAVMKGRKRIVDFLIDECKVSPFVRLRSNNKRPIELVPQDIDHKDETTYIREKLEKAMNDLLEKEPETTCLIGSNKKKEEGDDIQIVRLLNAAAIGDIQRFKSYSEYNLTVKDYDKRTALHVAVSDNQEHIVEYILERVDKNATTAEDRWGTTPLSDSSRPGKEEIHRLFLKYFPELKDTENDDFRTYLLLNAASKGDVDTLEELYRKNVDMELQDYDDRTALHLAAAENQLNAVKFLLETAKVKTSIPDRGHRKAEDETTNQEIKDLLETAIREEKSTSEIPKLSYRDEIMVMVLKASAKGYLHTLKDNQKFADFPFDSADLFKSTPLHVSASKGHKEDVKYLLKEKKVSPYVRNSFWKTPLELVEDKIGYLESEDKKSTLLQNFEFVKTLLVEAMEINLKEMVEEDQNFKKHESSDEKIFLFLNKTYKGNISAVKRYLKTDDNLLMYADYDKRTPLHLAAAEGHIHLVKFFLDFSKERKKVQEIINAKDRWHCTALDEAKKNKHQEMIDLLQSSPVFMEFD